MFLKFLPASGCCVCCAGFMARSTAGAGGATLRAASGPAAAALASSGGSSSSSSGSARIRPPQSAVPAAGFACQVGVTAAAALPLLLKEGTQCLQGHIFLAFPPKFAASPFVCVGGLPYPVSGTLMF